MNRTLKLALVTRRYPPLIGGAEKVLSYLAEALAAEGADVTVVTSRIPGLELAAREDVPVIDRRAKNRDKSARGRLTVVRLETSRLRFWGTWRYMRNLNRWFRENPIDLAYVSMLKHDAYAVIGAGRRLGFPVVLRPEGAGATGDVALAVVGQLRPEDRPSMPIGRMRSSRSPRPLSKNYERPGARERCGPRGGENGSIALRRHHRSWRSPTGFRFRRRPGSAGPNGGRRLARSSSDGWHPKRGWIR